MKNRILTAIACIAMILLTITVSISLPIYFRPFYYWQIEDLELPTVTGYDKATIRDAYDEVMDYLLLPNREFGTGVFPHSEEGAAHFADVKGLFNLNLSVMICSAATLILLAFLRRKELFRPCRPFGKHHAFTCGASILLIFGIIGIAAATDFSRFFVLFHGIFFPGKENWLFKASEDAIILVMPETFFLRCAALILCSILLLSIGMILFGLIHKVKKEEFV